jgi:mercuric reductase
MTARASRHFDIAIIGGGAGAFAAAIRANDLNANAAMMNHGLPLGGTCVNVGCVPSKTLLWAGEVLHLAKHHRIPGISVDVTQFDFAAVVRDELALVERLRHDKYEHVLQALPNVTFIDGRARFVSAHELDVDGERIAANKFVIAVGSTATVPPIPGLREAGFVTHIEALRLPAQPKELIVIGAGPLGLEFAQMYARFGTRVTILQRPSTVFPRTEERLAVKLAEVLQSEGITVETGITVQKVRSENGRKVVTYSTDRTDGRDIAADEILLATSKAPNTTDLGLDQAGVNVDQKQAIPVSPSLQTTQPHIYAVGDVTNLPKRLETTAGKEGTLAAENALTGSAKTIDYDAVPYTVFTDPQLAGVGLTEEEQMQRLGMCACRTIAFDDVPRAMIMKRTEGLIKMAIHPETDRIMGVHILAPHAGELIAEAMMLVRNRNTVDDVLDSLPMSPTLSEAIKLVATAFRRDISKLSCCV